MWGILGKGKRTAIVSGDIVLTRVRQKHSKHDDGGGGGGGRSSTQQAFSCHYVITEPALTSDEFDEFQAESSSTHQRTLRGTTTPSVSAVTTERSSRAPARSSSELMRRPSGVRQSARTRPPRCVPEV